ncbi:MAG TPA: methyltransferase domain-containing protein [Candidatus Eisenbacteria bacterium]
MSPDDIAVGTPGSVYIHGTAPEEQSRLTAMNRMINGRCLAALRLRPGESVLDVGSGLGQMTREMARVTGRRVIGIEASPAQREEAIRQATADGESDLVEFREGDAMNPPLRQEEWGAFDVTHTRFLLEHVTDPGAVVAAMLRATRPGGRLLLLDDIHSLLRLWPTVPGLSEVWLAYQRSYDRIGCDAAIGERLVEILHRAGAQPVRNELVFFGSCSGDPFFPTIVENLAVILEGARTNIVDAGYIPAADVDRVAAELRRWGRRPDAAFWYAMGMAEGRRPSS